MKYGLYARKSSEDSGKQIQSIEDQMQTLKDKAEKDGLIISKIYTESRSAKTPGRREQFNLMIEDLKTGKIQGIICWTLDRLSRNPLEGGIIMQHLQDGTIHKIITNQKIYFPGDNGLLMTIELGMATEYSRALAENTKRGQAFKLKKGSYPNKAPLGYMNTIDRIKGEKDVEPDPNSYNLVRGLWDLLLSGDYSVLQLTKKAHEIGLKIPATRNKTEKKLSKGCLYKLFRNPFYYGEFQWSGQLHQGRHQAMITREEFDAAQEMIEGRDRPKTYKHKFAFTNLIYCGECGATITAEHKNKVRKDGSINYRSYYRCTHRKVEMDCSQIAIRAEKLDEQMLGLLGSITVPTSFIQWAIKWLKEENEDAITKEKSVKEQQAKQLMKLDDQLKRLIDMKLEDLIDLESYKSKKESIMAEKRSIEKHIILGTDSQDYRTDKVIEVLEFCKTVKDIFKNGSVDDKKLALEALGSRFFLKDQKLSVELAIPFKLLQDGVNSGLVVDPRFATLPTRIETGFDVETCTLIKNGGGGEELPPASKSFQQ